MSPLGNPRRIRQLVGAPFVVGFRKIEPLEALSGKEFRCWRNWHFVSLPIISPIRFNAILWGEVSPDESEAGVALERCYNFTSWGDSK